MHHFCVFESVVLVVDSQATLDNPSLWQLSAPAPLSSFASTLSAVNMLTPPAASLCVSVIIPQSYKESLQLPVDANSTGGHIVAEHICVSPITTRLNAVSVLNSCATVESTTDSPVVTTPLMQTTLSKLQSISRVTFSRETVHHNFSPPNDKEIAIDCMRILQRIVNDFHIY